LIFRTVFPGIFSALPVEVEALLSASAARQVFSDEVECRVPFSLHDTQTENWRIPFVLTQSGSEDRTAEEFRNLQLEGGGREARARSSVLQAGALKAEEWVIGEIDLVNRPGRSNSHAGDFPGHQTARSLTGRLTAGEASLQSG
jgi:hypothetical protein